jgi:kynureninase
MANQPTLTYKSALAQARKADAQDPLRAWRKEFHIPKHEGKPVVYMTGNSLGLQPKGVKKALLAELNQWSTYGVEGHFKGDLPWMHYHKFLMEQTAKLVGARTNEVVVMNTLTTNLHLLMATFYRPTQQRYKIIMEGGAFPSDQYAMETQVRWHGHQPDQAIVEVHPRAGETHLRTEDILSTIAEHGKEAVMVMFGGVNYYTGQLYDMPTIARAAHAQGALAGFDLAHAAGNVPLQLHDWNIDFALWCSYKYLNSGPGGPSGVFIHERHATNTGLQRFGGWWGHDESERFQMRKGFKPMPTAEGWQLSNAQILSFAAHKVSLDMFAEVGMEALRAKSRLLYAFFDQLWAAWIPTDSGLRIITPTNPAERGCQVSILTGDNGRQIFQFLESRGVLTDWREPNVIRCAPVPFYNSFEDVCRLVWLLREGGG